MQLHAIGSKGLLPDRTLLLRLPQEAAKEREFSRDEGRLDRFGRKDGRYHTALTAFFQTLAADNPDRFRIVDAQGTELEVTEKLLAAVEDMR